MKRRFTEEQIIGVLREQEAGGTVKEVIRCSRPEIRTPGRCLLRTRPDRPAG